MNLLLENDQCAVSEMSNGDYLTALDNARLPESPYLNALRELLQVLCWKGTPKELVAALPLFTPLDFNGLRDVLARIGYETEISKTRDVAMLSSPALHIQSKDRLTVLPEDAPVPRGGQLLQVYPQVEPIEQPAQTSWLSWTISSMWNQLSGAWVASFFINAVGLALPFFTRYVYDRAIPAHSKNALFYLGAGVLLAVFFGTVFRILRSRLLTFASGRLAYLSGVESLNRILSLPLAVLTKSSTDAHILRLRDLERVREFVSGSFATTLMDAPFILLYLGAVAYLGGPLVLVPVCALVLLGLLIPFLSVAEDKAMRRAAKLNAERSSMQQDTVDKLKDLIGVGLEERWMDNYARIMVRSAAANKKLARVSSALRVLSRMGSSTTALATLVVGMWLVLSGSITPGALIASMMLIWRITAPAQTLATSFSRYFQLRHSAQQIERLMEIQGENLKSSLVSPLQDLKPNITINRVVFRHSPDREPALAGVTCQIEEGEIIGITGPNGAGKTTLLNAICGMAHPQGGSVLVGGRDIRQFLPEDLRSWFGFMPENDRPFRGTLRSNLLMARADATDEELLAALEEAGAGHLVEELPYGLDSFMYLQRGIRVGHDMQQAICIARSLLKNPRILMLDEPIFHSSQQRDNFFKILDNSRGNRTVLFTSHDRQLLEHCDKVLLLDQGVPVSFGKIAKPQESKTQTTQISLNTHDTNVMEPAS